MTIERAPGLDLEVQYVLETKGIPTRQEFDAWVRAALGGAQLPLEMVIRVVDEDESRQLNKRYRGKDKATNVLSFSFEAPAGIASCQLGDLVICVTVVNREAIEQNKPENHHWAHIVIHGILHLLGYDHINDGDAMIMEQLEIDLLDKLGISNPYEAK